jgi:hypothetical protein
MSHGEPDTEGTVLSYASRGLRRPITPFEWAVWLMPAWCALIMLASRFDIYWFRSYGPFWLASMFLPLIGACVSAFKHRWFLSGYSFVVFASVVVAFYRFGLQRAT